jgi:hypothetical protein
MFFLLGKLGKVGKGKLQGHANKRVGRFSKYDTECTDATTAAPPPAKHSTNLIFFRSAAGAVARLCLHVLTRCGMHLWRLQQFQTAPDKT